MGKEWDSFKTNSRSKGWAQQGKDGGDDFGGFGKKLRPSFYNQTREDRNNFIENMTDIFTEAKRVLKPGGHLFVWAIPKTSHWMATALEDSGLEIRDIITHVFGTGFPKSHSVSKGIDKIKGKKGIVVGTQKLGGTAATLKGKANRENWSDQGEGGTFTPEIDLVKPESPEAIKYEGWGTGLKTASEHWILCRKPLSEKTVAANVLKWGVGGINIDKSRIEFNGEEDKESAKPGSLNATGENSSFGLKSGNELNEQGRWPANFIHDGSDEVMEQFDKAGDRGNVYNGKRKKDTTSGTGHTLTGAEKKAGDSAGIYDGIGSPARFFYCSKPSKAEKNAGCDDLEKTQTIMPGRKITGNTLVDQLHGHKPPAANSHPTVKSTKLMSYLINMITPQDGIVLDPFMGSGTTGVAAIENNFNFIGIEKEENYFNICKARIENAKNNI